MKVVALIPARGGSKRIPGKNIKPLNGVPLLAYTIQAAKEAGLFSQVFVSTDDDAIAAVAWQYCAPTLTRDPLHATDDAPDVLWVKAALNTIEADAFVLLRPTSPFRSAQTIKRAWHWFQMNQPCDSLRAVEPVKQHPGKMWMLRGNRLLPVLPFETDGVPWHSRPTQTLPPMVVQNASLEIAWTRTVQETGTIAGEVVVPFFTEAEEGFDLNTPEDWERAEWLIRGGFVTLPDVQAPSSLACVS